MGQPEEPYSVIIDCPLLGTVELVGNLPAGAPGYAKGGLFMSVVVLPAGGL